MFHQSLTRIKCSCLNNPDRRGDSRAVKSACHIHSGPWFESRPEELCCMSHTPLSLPFPVYAYQIKVSMPEKNLKKKNNPDLLPADLQM